MITQQAQIKLTLPLKLKEYLESRAARFGLPLSGYVKHLIVKDVENMDFPVYQASRKTEQAYKKAMEEKNKAVKVKGDIGDFFNSL